jgi:hypothetical protein
MHSKHKADGRVLVNSLNTVKNIVCILWIPIIFIQGMFTRDYSVQYAQNPIQAIKQYVPYNLK